MRALIARWEGPLRHLPRTGTVAARLVRAALAVRRGAPPPPLALSLAFPAALPPAPPAPVLPGPAPARLPPADPPVALGAPDPHATRTSAALLAHLRPLYVTLLGDPLGHPDGLGLAREALAIGAVVELVAMPARLTPGTAYALVWSGVHRLVVDVGPDVDRAIRAVEQLVAMRDANRRPGPRVVLRVGAAELAATIARCAARFEDIEPVLAATAVGAPAAAEHAAEPDPAALAEAPDPAALAEARAAAVCAGFRTTVASIDAAARRPAGPCALPWFAIHVAPDGALHPCERRVGNAEPFGRLDEPAAASLTDAWTGPTIRALRAAGRADPTCAACPHADAGLGAWVVHDV